MINLMMCDLFMFLQMKKKKDPQVNCLFLTYRSWLVDFYTGIGGWACSEKCLERLINHQTFGSCLGEGNYASIVAILSSLFYGFPPPGDKCVNYYILCIFELYGLILLIFSFRVLLFWIYILPFVFV